MDLTMEDDVLRQKEVVSVTFDTTSLFWRDDSCPCPKCIVGNYSPSHCRELLPHRIVGNLACLIPVGAKCQICDEIGTGVPWELDKL